MILDHCVGCGKFLGDVEERAKKGGRYRYCDGVDCLYKEHEKWYRHVLRKLYTMRFEQLGGHEKHDYNHPPPDVVIDWLKEMRDKKNVDFP